MLQCSLACWSTAGWNLDGLLLYACSAETSQRQQREFRSFRLLTKVLALLCTWDKIEVGSIGSPEMFMVTNLEPDFCHVFLLLVLEAVIKLLGFCYLSVK